MNGEALPAGWATAGTTGYDVLGVVDRVLLLVSELASNSVRHAHAQGDGGTRCGRTGADVQGGAVVVRPVEQGGGRAVASSTAISALASVTISMSL